MKPFFSIAIPCCDIEPYVSECLQSILGQPFRDWECLIGIETSNDRTEQIIREMTAGDPRFRIFTDERTGSSSASRNSAIAIADGEYMIFLDGDDTIAEGCLARLHEKICANPGADLYPCAIVANNEITGEHKILDNYRADAQTELSGQEATIYLDSQWNGSFCPMLQMTIFRRRFLVENELKCIRGLRHQDNEFSPRALFFAKRVIPLHEPFYLHRIRVNSAESETKDAGSFLKDWAVITGSLLDFYGKVSENANYDPRVTPCWVRQWLPRMNYMWFSPKAISQIPRSKRRETLEFIFANGFWSYKDMLKRSGSSAEKMAGFWVRFFVEHRFLGWISESFFRFYFRTAERNQSETDSFQTRISQ